MKVLVIGATGATGRHLVKKLLGMGHEVTATARNPEDLKDFGPTLRTVQAEARDAASLVRAAQGQDVVMSAFGPRSFNVGDLQEVFMRNLVAAMKQEGAKRLVNLSAMGAGDSRMEAPFFFRAILMPLFFKKVFGDKERGEVILFASGLDFINVRPGRLLNSPARGGVKASLKGRDLKSDMTREDLADFMLQQMTNNEWLRQSPLIGY